MAAITTFNTLDSELARRLGRVDLSADTEIAAQMGQKRIVRDLQNKGATVGEETSTVITTTAGTQTIALPASFLAPGSMAFNAPYSDTLPLITMEEVQRLSGPFTSFPVAYAIYGSNIVFAPNPNAAYAFTFYYFAEPAPLNSGNQTNWFITNTPDLMFYACLTQLSDQVRDDKKIADYEAAYQAALSAVVSNQSQQRYGGGPPRMRGLNSLSRGFNIIANR